jgi:hypothetical protein
MLKRLLPLFTCCLLAAQNQQNPDQTQQNARKFLDATLFPLLQLPVLYHNNLDRMAHPDNTPKTHADGTPVLLGEIFWPAMDKAAADIATAIKTHQAWLGQHPNAAQDAASRAFDEAFKHGIANGSDKPPVTPSIDPAYRHALEAIGTDFRTTVARILIESRKYDPTTTTEGIAAAGLGEALREAMVRIYSESGGDVVQLTKTAQEAYPMLATPSAPPDLARIAAQLTAAQPPEEPARQTSPRQAPAYDFGATSHPKIPLREGYYVVNGLPRDRWPEDRQRLLHVTVKGDDISIVEYARARLPIKETLMFHGTYTSNPFKGDSGTPTAGAPMTIITPEQFVLGGVSSAYFNRLNDSATEGHRPASPAK